MNIFDRYKTDYQKEIDGTWVEFDGFKVKIARAGGSNQAYLKALERETKPYRRAIQNGSISLEIADKIVQKVYAETVVKGWEGITDEQGNPMAFSKETCAEVFEALPEFFAEVKQLAENMEMFRQVSLEAEAKN